MKILILSYYFPPDLSACSFRMESFIDELDKNHESIREIEVLTTSPNRYKSYDSYNDEQDHFRITNITRIPVTQHNSGMISQIIAFSKYFFSVLIYLRDKEYDLIFATSSKLMTAFLGGIISKKKNIPLFLDIRDIFIDTITDIFGRKYAYFLLPIFKKVESYTIKCSSKVNLVSKGFSEYFVTKYPDKYFSYITNGIDKKFLKEFDGNQKNSNPENNQHLKIMYAGNIGEGQGLHNIIPALAKRLKENASFIIIGDGGRKELLARRLSEERINNVLLKNPISRDKLIREYLGCSILFLHLNNYNAFKKVLPSKIFEYAATGLPIWAGVDGYAATFIKANIKNAVIFPPCDSDSAMKELENLSLSKSNRSTFKDNFDRSNLSAKLAQEFLSLYNV